MTVSLRADVARRRLQVPAQRCRQPLAVHAADYIAGMSDDLCLFGDDEPREEPVRNETPIADW